MKWHRLFLIIISLMTMLGFRTFFNKNRWDTAANPSAKTKLFVSYTNGDRSITNDLTEGDILNGSTLTLEVVMDSIFNDYNAINASYIQLVDTDDSDYDTYGTDRTITISFSGAGGANAGEAQLKTSGSKITGCEIKMEESLLDSAKDLIGVMTHELGHCVGLDHPQDNVRAIMSYFSDPDDIRLKMDDKMGVIYLFPTTQSKGKEESTWGLSCSKR